MITLFRLGAERLRSHISPVVLPLVLAGLAVGVPTAAGITEAARQPTRAEDSALLPAVRANIPAAWRSKSWIRTRVSTINSRWAGFMVNPRSGYESVVQTAYGYARRSGSRWVIVQLGNSGVGCAQVPQAVRAELMRAVQWGVDEC